MGEVSSDGNQGIFVPNSGQNSMLNDSSSIQGPITVYPKLHQTWTRVSPKSSGASATRAKTIRGFSKI
jgi:hypothetical protein